MPKLRAAKAAVLGLGLFVFSHQASAECSSPPIIIGGYSYETEGALTVKAGTGCRFNINGIEGAISEAKIVQPPKVGRAGIQSLMPYYVAKPGYTGPDEFSYAFIGTDQHGGPMRIVVKRKVTVVP